MKEFITTVEFVAQTLTSVDQLFLDVPCVIYIVGPQEPKCNVCLELVDWKLEAGHCQEANC